MTAHEIELTEHEIKFSLSDSMAAEFDAPAAEGEPVQRCRLANRYFDTPAGDLMNAGISLRVRHTPDGFVQTVKAAGDGPFERYEWEQPIAGETPDAGALPPPGDEPGDRIREVFSLLRPVFETDFERCIRLLRAADGTVIELACDRGEIRAGNRVEQIAEVELEHKAGSAAGFYQLARRWTSQHDARLLLPSKNERGLQLAGWLSERPDPVRAIPAAPTGEAPIAEAARRILTGHLHHILANLVPILTGVAEEGPHQLRVGLRRLRAAIRFLGLKAGVEDVPQPQIASGPGHPPVSLAPAGAPLRNGRMGAAQEAARRWTVIDAAARSLADAAGLVRDVDVLERGLLAELDTGFPGDAALQVTRRTLRLTREQDRQRLRNSIDDAGTTDFVLRTLIAIETLDAVNWPAQHFDLVAIQRLVALARKVRRRARAARVENDWHDVRIAIKNLRYALESCAGLTLDGDPATELAGPLGRWQETLGLGQDLAVARTVAGRALALGKAPADVSVRAAALIDGYRVYATRVGDPEKLRKPIIAAMDRLIRAARSEARASRDRYHAQTTDEADAIVIDPAPSALPPVPDRPSTVFDRLPDRKDNIA